MIGVWWALLAAGITEVKVRSVLTVLGILFGVWSVIAMLAINAGLTVYNTIQALTTAINTAAPRNPNRNCFFMAAIQDAFPPTVKHGVNL